MEVLHSQGGGLAVSRSAFALGALIVVLAADTRHSPSPGQSAPGNNSTHRSQFTVGGFRACDSSADWMDHSN